MPNNVQPPNMVQPRGDKIEETKANLPLPDQPPVASDWQSADATKVNVGSGRLEGNPGTDGAANTGLKSPATQGTDTDMSTIGRQGKEGLSEPPKDAAAR